ncbi:MAG: hypothetical protein ACOVMN_02815 [Flexibacteraceae bacterium]
MKNKVLVYGRLLVLLLVLGSFTSSLFASSVFGGAVSKVATTASEKKDSKSKDKPESTQQIIASTHSASVFLTLPSPNFEALMPDIQSVFFGSSFFELPILQAQVQSVFQLCVHRNLFFTSIQRSAP